MIQLFSIKPFITCQISPLLKAWLKAPKGILKKTLAPKLISELHSGSVKGYMYQKAGREGGWRRPPAGTKVGGHPVWLSEASDTTSNGSLDETRGHEIGSGGSMKHCISLNPVPVNSTRGALIAISTIVCYPLLMKLFFHYVNRVSSSKMFCIVYLL